MNRLDLCIDNLPTAEKLFATLTPEDIHEHKANINSTIEAYTQEWTSDMAASEYCYSTSLDKYTYILRRSVSTLVISDLSTYDIPHLENTLIKSVFVSSPRAAMKQIQFLLYYYFFYHYSEPAHGPLNRYVTWQSCISIEDIIKTIILKENTLYRHYQTAAAVQALRSVLGKLQAINIVQSVNLRGL